MQLDSQPGSSEEDVRGRGGAGDAYEQAAFLIEFLRESKFGKDECEEFPYAVGQVPGRDLEQIEAVFERVRGAKLDEDRRALERLLQEALSALSARRAGGRRWSTT